MIFKDYIPRHTAYRDVYRICMNSKEGRKLYLTVDQVFGLNKDGTYKRSYKWSPVKIGSMEFDKKQEAEEFAKEYFKHFDKWFIDYSEEYDGSI